MLVFRLSSVCKVSKSGAPDFAAKPVDTAMASVVTPLCMGLVVVVSAQGIYCLVLLFAWNSLSIMLLRVYTDYGRETFGFPRALNYVVTSLVAVETFQVSQILLTFFPAASCNTYTGSFFIGLEPGQNLPRVVSWHSPTLL